MKAILRSCAGPILILVITNAASATDWVSPVFRQPFPVAPSPSNSGFYLVDASGRVTGPHYYLVPPCQPFNGMLPGPIGQAIQQGNLPHTLLMSKEAMTVGDAPMLGQKQPQPSGPPDAQYAAAPNAGGHGFMPYGPGSQYPMSAAGPYPTPNMQTPYGLPYTPYALQPPYVPPMLPYAQQAPMMPYPQPMQPAPRPIAYGQPNYYNVAWQDPRYAVWQAQMANPRPAPFMPIPGHNPNMAPAAPMQPIPYIPPGMGGPNGGFTQFAPPAAPMAPNVPLQQMQPLEQLQRMQPMQFPPPRPPGGAAYPTHPFTRSPRDFFMWSDMMDEERARANRPFPVP